MNCIRIKYVALNTMGLNDFRTIYIKFKMYIRSE